MKASTETVNCPYCGSNHYTDWAEEAGFNCVRCNECRILYCNPRPGAEATDMAVRAGAHVAELGGLVVTSHHLPRKVRYYHSILAELFDDIWKKQQPFVWIDVGAGYGEFIEAVSTLAPAGSSICGFEPMRHKAEHAQARGLNVINDYLPPLLSQKADFISAIDVLSHIPDFAVFLAEIRGTLKPGGELFIETGNLADVENRRNFPGELGLPDHLVFAGQEHMIGYLDRLGFDVVKIRTERIDGLINLAKNTIKLIIGRPGRIGIPYSSKYRQLQIRARLRA
jgi:SAM-dependent methyltransferase